MNVGVVVAAAGRGTRMGQPRAKVLTPLAGVPVVVRATRAFAATAAVQSIVVVAAAADVNEVRSLLARHDVRKIIAVVPGGATRQESVGRGLDVLPACDVVLVHDGARPLVSAALIERVVAAAAQHGAAIPVVPVPDTLKRVDGDRIGGTVDRMSVARAQTPQGFRADLLRRAVARARDSAFEGTDESALVERLGAAVRCVDGCIENLKITTPEDLVIAEALLAWQGA